MPWCCLARLFHLIVASPPQLFRRVLGRCRSSLAACSAGLAALSSRASAAPQTDLVGWPAAGSAQFLSVRPRSHLPHVIAARSGIGSSRPLLGLHTPRIYLGPAGPLYPALIYLPCPSPCRGVLLGDPRGPPPSQGRRRYWQRYRRCCPPRKGIYHLWCLRVMEQANPWGGNVDAPSGGTGDAAGAPAPAVPGVTNIEPSGGTDATSRQARRYAPLRELEAAWAAANAAAAAMRVDSGLVASSRSAGATTTAAAGPPAHRRRGLSRLPSEGRGDGRARRSG